MAKADAANQQVPEPATMTRAPLQNRLEVELVARPEQVWSLLGDMSRYPEYSAGLERVDAETDTSGSCTAYVCHFKPMAPGEGTLAHREEMVWYSRGHGYASRGEEPNAFGLRDSVTIVTLEPSARGTRVSWSQYFEAEDVVTARAVFDEALQDIGENLVGRFGGSVTARVAGEQAA